MNMPQTVVKNILICGGTGFIGSQLCPLVLEKGHRLAVFTRKNSQSGFLWNPQTDYLNPDVLKCADVIINLAGAGIADQRWSKRRKLEIIDSRVKSTQLLYNKLNELKHKPQVFIHASAIGFYGNNSQETVTETSLPGKGFLPYVAWHWEEQARKIANLGIRTVILRIGLVLSNQGGALPKMIKPFRFFTGGVVLGSGEQVISWIHIDDLCRMILMAIEKKKWNGVYNAVSPETVTNREFARSVAKTLKKQILIPTIPSFFLRTLMGEMACLLLEGTKASAEKVLSNGFNFHYPKIENALENLIPLE